MWFEERSWSNLKMSSMLVEEWRDLWSLKIDFIVASFAYVFSTNNFLSLPALILQNGGLAFVVAYGASLLFCVLPIIVMEFSVGQLTGRAPVEALYNICPLFKGVGVSQIIFSLLIMAHMTRYTAWLMLYLFHLFWALLAGRPGLPWLHCENFAELQTSPCEEAGAVANASTTGLNTLSEHSSLVQFMTMLERPSSNIAETGYLQYYILASMGTVWILVFLATCFGVRWLGKVVHFTFIMPVVLLCLLLVRALTLQGLPEILVKFYEITDWQRMTDYLMWKAAIEQAVFATGIGFGAFITIASYNKRTNNLVGDALLILIGHVVLTLIQVLVTVGFLGYLCVQLGLQPLELLDRGETQMWHILAYMSHVPNTRTWTAILLFMCIFVLLNIFYVLTLNILATLEDALGDKSSRCFWRFVLDLLICCVVFASSLYFATQGGRYAYELVGGYLKYVTLWIILFFELLAVGWFYCAHRLGKDLHTMLRRACCWCLGHFILYFIYLLPVIPVAMAVLNLINYDYSIYSSGIHEWKYSEMVGWTIALVPLLPISLFMQFRLCRICIKGPGVTKWQKLKNAASSPLRYEVIETSPSKAMRGYSNDTPGYTLLSQAPLAEPEV